MEYKTIAVDGSYLTRRSFEVGRSEGGTGRSSLIGGSTSVLLGLVADHPEAALVVAWEPPSGDSEPCDRRVISPDYKAARKEPPEEYRIARDAFRDLVCLLGFDQVHAPGLEADDAIATLSRSAPCLIWSADKDLLQLVGPAVHMIRPTTGKDIITPENVVERTGLTPAQWTSLLVFAGDTSDGIPGLPRVGADRAKRLIAACPNLLDWIIDGSIEAREQSMMVCAASDPKALQWVELAWTHRTIVLECFDLVRLRTPPLVRRSGCRELQVAAEWLRRERLDYLSQQIESLERDPWLTEEPDLDKLPF